MRKIAVVLIFLLAIFAIAEGKDLESRDDDYVFTIKITPGLSMPIGEDREVYDLGCGVDIAGLYRIPLAPSVDVNFIGEIGYNYTSMKEDNSVSHLLFDAGTGVSWELLSGFTLGVNGCLGYCYAFLNRLNEDTIGGNGNTGMGSYFLAGGLSLAYRIAPAIGLGIDVYYRNIFDLRNDIVAALVLLYHFPRPRSIPKSIKRQPVQPEPLELEKVEFEEIFPVFYKYYDEHLFGRITLLNRTKSTAHKIKVSFFVRRYMDDPKYIMITDPLRPGERKNIELYGLFTNKILEVSEGTKVTANITVEYFLDGESQKNEFVRTLRIHNRNALTWDDDRKAAAFVTAKDTSVMQFSKNVTSAVKGMYGLAVNRNLRTGLVLFEALSLYGMSYAVDPTTPYREFSKDKKALDFVQFPRQTLAFKAGDCDDLTILYCALLESLGVETAFITIPGHILMAFSLDMLPREAQKTFTYRQDLIFRENEVWLPVEVTQMGKGFLSAWAMGAKEWREYSDTYQAGFYPMHDSWNYYEPVGFIEETAPLTLLPEPEIRLVFLEEINRFVQREIEPREERLKAEIQRTKGSNKIVNELGVLYARYGLKEKAKELFRKILLEEEYLPALINMGNLYYLSQDMDAALGLYERASRKAPTNPNVLLCLSRVHHAMENYGMASIAYDRLKSIDSTLTLRFTYLDPGLKEYERQSNFAERRYTVIWEEE